MGFFDVFKSSYHRNITEIMKRQCIAFAEDIYNNVLPETMLSNKNIKCTEIIYFGMFIAIASYIMAYGMSGDILKHLNNLKNTMQNVTNKWCKIYSPDEVYSTSLFNDFADLRLREYMAIHAAYVEQGIFLFMAVQKLLNYVFVSAIDFETKNSFSRITIDKTVKHWTDNSREFFYNKS